MTSHDDEPTSDQLRNVPGKEPQEFQGLEASADWPRAESGASAQAELPVPFGEIAVALGYCTEEHVRAALAEQRGTGALAGRGIGYVLTQSGILDTKQRDEILAFQRVQFRRFSPTADSRRGDERLGRLVTERGLVGYPDFVKALEAQGELRDVDGNTPPLGKVFVELRLLSEGQLAEVLESVGVDVYACENCHEAFNVVGREDLQRRLCCPLCHANQVDKARDRVLDVLGTLQLGRPLVPYEPEAGGAQAPPPDPGGSTVESETSGVGGARAGGGVRASGAASSTRESDPPATAPSAPAAGSSPTEEPSSASGRRYRTSRRVSLPAAPGSPPPSATEHSLDSPASSPPPAGERPSRSESPAETQKSPAPETAGLEEEQRKAADSSLLNLAEDLGIEPDTGAGETAMLGVRLESSRGAEGAGTQQRRHSDRLYDDRPPTPGPAKRRDTSSTLATALRTIGPFRVLDEIGRGEFGIVFHAQHTETNEEVALRVLLGELARDTNYLMRLERQAATLRRLQYPGIAHLVATGRVGDLVYVATRYVRGKTLDEWVRIAAPSLLERLEMLVKLAEALAFAHDHNVLHLRLSPREILVDEQGQPWITDFGLLQPIALDDDVPSTGLGSLETAMRRRRVRRAGRAALVGPAGYLAPEQVRSTEQVVLDGRADQFSLSVLGYELVSGVHPFITGSNADIVEVLQNVLREDPPPLKHLVQELPEGLENVLLKGVEKKREGRYESCLFFAADLQRVMEGEPVEAPSPYGLNRLWRIMRRNPVVASVTMFLVAVGLSVFALWALELASAPDETPGAPSAVLEGPLQPAEQTDHPLERALRAGNVREAAHWIAELPAEPERNELEWRWVAHYELLRGQHAAALEAAQTAAEVSGEVGEFLHLGELAEQAHAEDLAREAYQRAQEFAGPEAAEPVLAEARLLRGQARYSELRSLLEPALARMPNEPELRAHYALALGRTGAAAAALRRIDQALDDYDERGIRALFYRERALILGHPETEGYSLDSLRHAEADLLLALEANPRQRGTLGALTENRRAQVQWRLEEAPAYSLGNPGGAVQRAELMLELGLYGETQAELATFVDRLGPRTPVELAALYGLALARVGEQRLAGHVFDALEARLAPHGSAELDGARLAAAFPGPAAGREPFVERSELPTLRRAAQRYTQRRPGELAGWLWLARVTLSLGDVVAAERALHRAQGLAPADPRLNYLAGLVAWETGREREARQRFAEALGRLERPEQARAVVAAAVQLGKLELSQGGDAGQALKRLAELAERLPDPLEAGVARARLLLAQGTDGTAATQLEGVSHAVNRRSSRSRRGREVTWLLECAHLLRTLGHFDEASSVYASVLDFDRHQRRATRELFFLAQTTERFAVSLAQLRRYRDEDPRSLLFAELEARHLARQDAEAAEQRWRDLETTPGAITRLAGSLEERQATQYNHAVTRAAAEGRMWRHVLTAPGRDYPLWLTPRSASDATDRAEAHLRHGNALAARVQLDVSVPPELDTLRSRRLRTHALMHLGALPAAQRQADELLEEHDDGYSFIQRADDLATAALIKLERGEATEAELLAHDANQHVGERPQSVTALRVLAHLALARQDLAGARRKFQRAVESGGGATRGGSQTDRPVPPDRPVEALSDYALLEYIAVILEQRDDTAGSERAALDEALTLLDRASSARHRGHGGGQLQRILLTLGLAHLEADQPVLARNALSAAADWPAAQADGAPDSCHARRARLVLALEADPLLAGLSPGTPSLPPARGAGRTRSASRIRIHDEHTRGAQAWQRQSELANPRGLAPQWRYAESVLATYRQLGHAATHPGRSTSPSTSSAADARHLAQLLEAWRAHPPQDNGRTAGRLAVVSALVEAYGPEPHDAVRELESLAEYALREGHLGAQPGESGHASAFPAEFGHILALLRAGETTRARRALRTLRAKLESGARAAGATESQAADADAHSSGSDNGSDNQDLSLSLRLSLGVLAAWVDLADGNPHAAVQHLERIRVEPADPLDETWMTWRLVAAAYSDDERILNDTLDEVTGAGRTPPAWLAKPHTTTRLLRALLDAPLLNHHGLMPPQRASGVWQVPEHERTSRLSATEASRSRNAQRLLAAAERADLAPLPAAQLSAYLSLRRGEFDTTEAHLEQAHALDPTSPVTRRLLALHAYEQARQAAGDAGVALHTAADLVRHGPTETLPAAQREALAKADEQVRSARSELAAAAAATDEPGVAALLAAKRLRLGGESEAALRKLYPLAESSEGATPRRFASAAAVQRGLLAEMLRNITALDDAWTARQWLTRLRELPPPRLPTWGGERADVSAPFAAVQAHYLERAAQTGEWPAARAALAALERRQPRGGAAPEADPWARRLAGPEAAWQSYVAAHEMLATRTSARTRRFTRLVEEAEEVAEAATAAHERAATGIQEDNGEQREQPLSSAAQEALAERAAWWRAWHRFLAGVADPLVPGEPPNATQRRAPEDPDASEAPHADRAEETRFHAAIRLADGLSLTWHGKWPRALAALRTSYEATYPPAAAERGLLTDEQAAAAAYLTLALEAALADHESSRLDANETAPAAGANLDAGTLQAWQAERQRLRSQLVEWAASHVQARSRSAAAPGASVPAPQARSPHRSSPGLTAAWRLAVLATQRAGEVDRLAEWLPVALAATGDANLVRDVLANVRTRRTLDELVQHLTTREAPLSPLLVEALAVQAYRLGSFPLADEILSRHWQDLSPATRHNLAPLRHAAQRLAH